MTPLRNNLVETEEIEMDSTVESPNGNGTPSGNGIKRKLNETEEEKQARRKLERKNRSNFRKSQSVAKSGPVISKKLLKDFNQLFNQENDFVLSVQQALPEVRNPHIWEDEEEKSDNFLLEDEGTKKTEEKRQKFLAKMKEMQKNKGMKKEGDSSAEPQRAETHEELKDRLHAKIALLGQKKNEKKRLRKLKKKEMQKEDDTLDSKKKFTSKANPNLKKQKKAGDSLKEEQNIQQSAAEKTPLRKKPVVKSNGEIVFSKFDFISEDKRQDGKGKPTAESLLQKVQKNESKLAKLESSGKIAEAATLVETQKWDSALKRAQGEKIRDDPTLLKKTIKKQDKRKQVSKKKWEERNERVEKEKGAKQEKRKANIQARKDDRVKKGKKQQRKKGRIE